MNGWMNREGRKGRKAPYKCSSFTIYHGWRRSLGGSRIKWTKWTKRSASVSLKLKCSLKVIANLRNLENLCGSLPALNLTACQSNRQKSHRPPLPTTPHPPQTGLEPHLSRTSLLHQIQGVKTSAIVTYFIQTRTIHQWLICRLINFSIKFHKMVTSQFPQSPRWRHQIITPPKLKDIQMTITWDSCWWRSWNM